MRPAATVVFTTHNRRELLERAIRSAQAQTVPVEIIVMDDNSRDGTAMMMRSEFPQIPYYPTAEGKGPCFHRNRGIAMAQSDIVFPLDDDSILQSPHTVEQTLADFDDPRIGAVAIPYVNILQTDRIFGRPPQPRGLYAMSAFCAASHAVRKDVFLEAGGYRELFFYMVEEGDLCIRMLRRGYVVRAGRADVIHHHQPPKRVSFPADFYSRRNDILFVTLNYPAAYLPLFLIGTTIKGLLDGARKGRTGPMAKGCYDGYRTAVAAWDERDPVDVACFHCFRELRRKGAMAIEDIEWCLNARPKTQVSTGRGELQIELQDR
jgi:GT2 family glycosyltransferase